MRTTWSDATDDDLKLAKLRFNHRLNHEALTPLKRDLVTWLLGDLHTEMALRRNAKREAQP